MNNESANRIRRSLETTYDIPFDVAATMHYKDAWLTIKPQNSDRELFEVDFKIKNQIRMVVEVTPEKYSAFSMQDMASASAEKKAIFSAYARQLQERKAKIEFFINNILVNETTPEMWPEKWINYRFRMTRSPICQEEEQYNEEEIALSWATIVIGMFLSLLNVVQVDIDQTHYEGGMKRVEINRYERNPINRELCLAANGYICKVCGFDFEKKYGRLGHHFIHVHHIIPISKMSDAYVIDPVNDLIPVCPNCHAMLHHSNPTMLPKELIELIRLQEEQFSEEKQK